jgi:adenosylcobinamide kinase / adenosylcobinamide-phosphate guanylyltransferase
VGKIIYITGGAKSGKSKFAEKMVEEIGEKINYIATLTCFDDEMKEKVKIHKDRRNEKYKTIEAHKNFDIIFENIDEKETILLDCLTNMVSNLIFEENIDFDKNLKINKEKLDIKIKKEVENLIKVLKKHKGISVIVSNELGMGIVPVYPLGRYFRDIAGEINQYVAEKSDEMYLTVSGIPMKIKG